MGRRKGTTRLCGVPTKRCAVDRIGPALEPRVQMAQICRGPLEA